MGCASQPMIRILTICTHSSGSVCLDVINQTWSPMYDMINIFEVFLPQLLRYPNPSDPLNGEAAALMMREPKAYEAKVKGMNSESFCRISSFSPMIFCRVSSLTFSQNTYRSMQARKPWTKQGKTPSLKTSSAQQAAMNQAAKSLLVPWMMCDGLF